MKKLLIGAVLLIIAIAGYWLVSPAFINETINEELPEGFATEAEFTEAVETLMVKAPEEMRHVFKEEMMELGKEEITVKDEMPEPKEERLLAEPDKPAPGPELLGSGNFEDVAHHGSGLAKLFSTEDGGLLRFENLDVLNGPDLRVLLSPNANVQSSGDLGEYIELDKLKGNKGNQNYVIGADVDLSQYSSVVIYCKPFHVVFNSAELQ